jgi:hypothetical protein
MAQASTAELKRPTTNDGAAELEAAHRVMELAGCHGQRIGLKVNELRMAGTSWREIFSVLALLLQSPPDAFSNMPLHVPSRQLAHVRLQHDLAGFIPDHLRISPRCAGLLHERPVALYERITFGQ